MALLSEWLDGWTQDGKPLPISLANKYRALQGLDPLPPRPGEKIIQLPPFLVGAGPSVGAGDSIAKILIRMQLAKPAAAFIRWAFKTTDCGCRARQAKWNKRWPWPAWWKQSIGTWWRTWI